MSEEINKDDFDKMMNEVMKTTDLFERAKILARIAALHAAQAADTQEMAKLCVEQAVKQGWESGLKSFATPTDKENE
jgi:hypothetical protein